MGFEKIIIFLGIIALFLIKVFITKKFLFPFHLLFLLFIFTFLYNLLFRASDISKILAIILGILSILFLPGK